MTTTKKRLLLSIAGAAMLCAGAVFTTLAATAKPQITDETMLANIEALSDPESAGNREDCDYAPGCDCPLVTITPSGNHVKPTPDYKKKPGWI